MSPEEEEATDRLLFHLENQTGFWFALVVSDDPAPRARMCEAARSWCARHERPFFLHAPGAGGLVTLAVTLANGDEPGIHWIRADGLESLLEDWSSGAAQMLMAMNERREAYRRRLDGGVIVEGRSSLKRTLREMAPDLFSIRAFVAEPGADPSQHDDGLPEWHPPVSPTWVVSADLVDADRALARLARVAWLGDSATSKEWLAAELRLVCGLLADRRHEEAELHAREVLGRIERGGVAARKAAARVEAVVCSLLAGILHSRAGDVSAALQLCDRAIGIWDAYAEEKGGLEVEDVFVFAQALRHKANVLRASGELSLATKVLRQRIRLFTDHRSSLPAQSLLGLLEDQLTLGMVLAGSQEVDVAQDILRNAVSVAVDGAAKYPEDDRWRLETLRANSRLALVQMLAEDTLGARATLLSVAPLAESLEHHQGTSEFGRAVLNKLYFYLGISLADEEKYSEATDAVRTRAISNIRRQVERNPDNLRVGWSLARILFERAALLETADLAGAKEAAREALDLVKKLSVRNDVDAELKRKIEGLRPFVGESRRRRGAAKR